MHALHLNAHNQTRKLQFKTKLIQCNTWDKELHLPTKNECSSIFFHFQRGTIIT